MFILQSDYQVGHDLGLANISQCFGGVSTYISIFILQSGYQVGYGRGFANPPQCAYGRSSYLPNFILQSGYQMGHSRGLANLPQGRDGSPACQIIFILQSSYQVRDSRGLANLPQGRDGVRIFVDYAFCKAAIRWGTPVMPICPRRGRFLLYSATLHHPVKCHSRGLAHSQGRTAPLIILQSVSGGAGRASPICPKAEAACPRSTTSSSSCKVTIRWGTGGLANLQGKVALQRTSLSCKAATDNAKVRPNDPSFHPDKAAIVHCVDLPQGEGGLPTYYPIIFILQSDYQVGHGGGLANLAQGVGSAPTYIPVFILQRRLSGGHSRGLATLANCQPPNVHPCVQPILRPSPISPKASLLSYISLLSCKAVIRRVYPSPTPCASTQQCRCKWNQRRSRK